MKPPAVPVSAALLWIALLHGPAAPLQGATYGVRMWQTDEGLPHNSVTAIAQTQDHYLWVGTRSGLARFDGMQFASAPAHGNPRQTAIDALHAGADATLWIATSDRLGELRRGTLLWHSFPKGLNSRAAHALVESPDGSVWVGTDRGLLRFRNGSFVHFTAADPLAGERVLSLCADGRSLWIGTERGLCSLVDGVIVQAQVETVPPSTPVRAIMRGRDGRLWIAAGETLIQATTDVEPGRWSRISSTGSLTALHEDRHGNIWVGAEDGLFQVFQSSLIPQLDENDRPLDAVLTIRSDHEDNVWAGTREGLVRLRLRPFDAYTREHGLLPGNIHALVQDTESNVWIAVESGLNCINPGGTILSFTSQNSELRGTVDALARRNEGGLWLGTREGKVFRFQRGLTVDYSPALHLDGSPVRAIFEEPSGRLCIGTRNGFHVYNRGEARRYTTADGLPGHDVRVICRDTAGHLWLGTEKGLALWRDHRFRVYSLQDGLSGNAITAIHADADSNLWVAIAGYGLCRARDSSRPPAPGSRSPWFRSYTTKDGLFSLDILEILEDASGNLWMSSIHGVFRIHKTEVDALDRGSGGPLNAIACGKADGLPSPQCAGDGRPAATRTRDGRLWFATTRGVAVADPSRMDTMPVAPRVVVHKIVADGADHDVPGSDAPVVLPPGRGELQFHFAALSYAAPEKTRFKYQLEGVDPHWIDGGARRSAHYNNVPPGSYRFRVTACSHTGVWSDTGMSVAVVLKPYFWQTRWFLGCSVALAASLAAGAARYVTRRRVREQLRRYEQQHALERERARISQNMHDDLGARLTEILLLNEHAQTAESPESRRQAQTQISEVTRGIGQSLNALVWAVSPQNDSLQKTALYLWHHLDRFFAPTPIQCRFDTPEHWPDLAVSSETRHNLFLVVKEAANNIAKHAEASEVKCSLAINGGTLVITIEDNGKGMTLEDCSEFGNGLGNMNKRMQEIGGTFGIESEPGKGTRIQLTLPLARGQS